MLSEYLKDENWQSIMPGIKFCQFSKKLQPEKNKEIINNQFESSMVEILFCFSGTIKLHTKTDTIKRINEQEILFLSDNKLIKSAEIDSALDGLCLTIDCKLIESNFTYLCDKLLNFPLSISEIKNILSSRGGFYIVHETPWSSFAFYTITKLPNEKKGHYCVIKCFELLFLLYIYEKKENKNNKVTIYDNYLSKLGADMQKYLLEHINEKITINDLSNHFHISPTTCKKCFFEYSSQPIHKWLLDKRMEKATVLLKNTKLSIIQISEEVGYDGTSQFNLMFKKRYGLTPNQYRKMSFSIYV